MVVVDIQQTQPLHQTFWPNVPIMGTIEWLLVQRNIPVTPTQSIVEITLTCAYCQQVGHEFKNCPLMINWRDWWEKNL
jgi:hypothetical protein